MNDRPSSIVIRTLRSFILAMFIFGLVGTATELVLLDHMEDYRQWVPLVLMGVGTAVALGLVLTKKPGVVYLFRGVMVLFILSGGLGIYFHFQGNMEFELEMYPSMNGMELFMESITGATPALAPGTMALFGFLGLVYTYAHPILNRTQETRTPVNENLS